MLVLFGTLIKTFTVTTSKTTAKPRRTSGSAIAEGPRDVLVSRNSATTKYRYHVALFA